MLTLYKKYFFICAVFLHFNQSISAMDELKSKKIEVTVFNDSKSLVIVKYAKHEAVWERVKDLDREHVRHLCCTEPLMPNKYSAKIIISNFPDRWVAIYFNNEKTEILIDDNTQDIVKAAFVPQEADGVWKMKSITGKREVLKSSRIHTLVAMVKANGSIELKPS